LYPNLYETHFSYIGNANRYCQSYRCRKCGDSLWKKAWHLERHERTCTGGIRKIYPGGVYHPNSTVFERLDEENIHVPEALRYYTYRATFDFKCWFDTSQRPKDSDKVHWIARHVLLGVSVTSNVFALVSTPPMKPSKMITRESSWYSRKRCRSGTTRNVRHGCILTTAMRRKTRRAKRHTQKRPIPTEASWDKFRFHSRNIKRVSTD